MRPSNPHSKRVVFHKNVARFARANYQMDPRARFSQGSTGASPYPVLNPCGISPLFYHPSGILSILSILSKGAFPISRLRSIRVYPRLKSPSPLAFIGVHSRLPHSPSSRKRPRPQFAILYGPDWRHAAESGSSTSFHDRTPGRCRADRDALQNFTGPCFPTPSGLSYPSFASFASVPNPVSIPLRASASSSVALRTNVRVNLRHLRIIPNSLLTLRLRVSAREFFPFPRPIIQSCINYREERAFRTVTLLPPRRGLSVRKSIPSPIL
jgi:hypothetical protein